MGKTLGIIVGVIAIAAVIYFAPELAPALASIGLSTATASAVATAIIATTLSVGASMIFRGLGIGGVPSARGQVGPPTVFRQTITSSFIVYGERRVGGLMVFYHSVQGSSGAHFRYFVIACAGHQCKGVKQWMLNDEHVTVNATTGLVTSGTYANQAWLWFVRGTSSDVANSTFVAECGGNWTTAHKGLGVAKVYAKFKLNDDLVSAGLPNITAVIEGRDEILDPRTGTTGYTRNAALIFYDWMQLLREEGGYGAYADEIPDGSWINAQANVCDETVDGEARYAIDAVIETGAPPGQVRDALVVNMAGSYTFSGGKHLMRPGYWVPVSATLSEDDLAAGIQVSAFVTADQVANQITGTFIDPSNGYQGMPFTTQTSSDPDVRQVDVDLAFVTSLKRANRIAKIMLNRAACEKTVVWPMNIEGLKITALQTVQLGTTRYGLSNYAWVVSNWQFSSDFGAVISLREENEEIYGDGTTTLPSAPPTVVVPGPIQTLQEIQAAVRTTYPRGLTMDAIDAGSDATVRLYGATTSAGFTLDYPGASDPVVGPHSFTGLAYSTTYYPYCDVASVGDASPVFGITTTYSDAINSTANPFRIYFGRAVITPASGGGTTTGGGLSGGYGGGGGFSGPGGGGGVSYA